MNTVRIHSSKVRIHSSKPFVSQFNGQEVKLATKPKTDEPIIGASGNTKLYTLKSGGGLFLDESDLQKQVA